LARGRDGWVRTCLKNLLRKVPKIWLHHALPTSGVQDAGLFCSFSRFSGLCDMARETMQIFYEGRVQGVGFRYATKSLARGFEITGVVRNLEDGRSGLRSWPIYPPRERDMVPRQKLLSRI
jgi:hypothetical protein